MKNLEKSRRYLCKFYYIGTKNFHGSQRQLNKYTIEECIIDALNQKKYFTDIKKSGIEFASRTDRFVSARGAVFSFITNRRPILMEINSALPRNIGLWCSAEVPIDFKSRFKAINRHYKYIFAQHDDFINNIDFELVLKACKSLEGRHNFVNFCKIESDDIKTVRDIDLASVKKEDNFLIFDFKSKSFLRQQIRRMISKIMEVGLKEIKFQDFLKLFDNTNIVSYQPADPKGLILWDVNFGDDIDFEIDLKSLERMLIYFHNQDLKNRLKQKLFSVLQQDNFSK